MIPTFLENFLFLVELHTYLLSSYTLATPLCLSCFLLINLISKCGQGLQTQPLDFHPSNQYKIYTHSLGYLVLSHGHMDHLNAEGFYIYISNPHMSPQHAELNIKLTIYIFIWVCNRHFILPVPNSKLLTYIFLLLPRNKDKNKLLLLYFSPFQFLATSFFRLMPKSWVIFLPFISHLRYGLSAKHDTSTFKTYKEFNHIS